jgi:hypothetical protein
MPKKGNAKIIRIHNNLSRGILSCFENKEMGKYIPHMSLGNFDSEEEREKAILELDKSSLLIKFKIDKIQLLTIDSKHKLKSIKNYKLAI